MVQGGGPWVWVCTGLSEGYFKDLSTYSLSIFLSVFLIIFLTIFPTLEAL